MNLKSKTWIILIFILFAISITLSCLAVLILKYYKIENLDNMQSTEVVENTNLSNSIYMFGIDVSHYQGEINWIEFQKSLHPIQYVFIRATMGKDGKDHHFKENWENAKKYKYTRGAYHYYRPNENSAIQFANYAESVSLEKGDFIPILDIEQPSIYGQDNLRAGITNWLKLAEDEYGVKPIVYTGLSFYNDNLQDHLDDYPLWIAAYSGMGRIGNLDWKFHQFTDQIIVKGILTNVDGNNFKGELKDFNDMLIK